MVLGLLNIPFKSIVLNYDDEKTPIELTDKKMLPIMSIDGQNLNESLNIIQKLDKKNILKYELYPKHKEEIDQLLTQVGTDVHNLAMPYWIWSPEFNNQSRDYFQKKKEIKRGPFAKLVSQRDIYTRNISTTLESLASNITTFYKSETITILDIQIASHLWGLYIVPEFQFNPKLNSYLQRVKKECHFNYHQDFWK
jgi:glutaredoxin 2